jgi:uncharacterized protein
MIKISCAAYVSACALLLPVSPPIALASETTQNEAIVRNAFDTWAEGTYIFDRILAPDVVWTIHGSGPVAGTYTSMEDFVARASVPLVSRLATPLIPEVHDLWAIGDTVIIRFDGSATTTSGAPYANQFVWIFRMENGLVTEAEAFLDLMAYEEVVKNNAPRAD